MRKSIKYCPVCGNLLQTKLTEERERLVCPVCGWVNYENPIPSVAILVKNKDNQILLIKRGVEPGKGEWALPSGFIESDESPEETALRELFEETGIGGRIKRLIGVYSEPTETYGRVLLVAYEAEFIDGHPKAGSDTVEVGFFSKEEMPNIPFASHNAIIKDALTLKRRA